MSVLLIISISLLNPYLIQVFFLLTTGWGPYAYFDALLEESNNNNRDAGQTTNALTLQTMEVHAVNQTLRSNGDYFSAPPLDSDPTSRLDDIELGRR